MRRWTFLIVAVLLLVPLFSGCVMRTVDEMYCLPQRSETYNSLQSAINASMISLEYCAPVAGENQQTVQMADLDGDGLQEYLLFAKDDSQRPLRILVFDYLNGSFVHTDTIELGGSAFDRVEYAQIDGRGGVEIVVGRMLSDQMLRSVSVYSLSNGEAEHLVTANYRSFLTVDLDDNRQSELFVIRPGAAEIEPALVELYAVRDGIVERSMERKMSQSADKLKRILIGKLHGGQNAVFVASAMGENALITDVYTLIDHVLTNVSVSSESGTSVQTVRNYYIYADDIDSDEVIELPNLMDMRPLEGERVPAQQNLIRWYAMTPDGSEVDKLYTYHNFLGGWYMDIPRELAPNLTVTGQNNTYEFFIWDAQGTAQKLMTIYVLTGQSREEQSVLNGRFVLHRADTVIYSASLEPYAQIHDISVEQVIRSFHLIHEDWKTGET